MRSNKVVYLEITAFILLKSAGGRRMSIFWFKNIGIIIF
jgi:hypothetical protein